MFSPDVLKKGVAVLVEGKVFYINETAGNNILCKSKQFASNTR